MGCRILGYKSNCSLSANQIYYQPPVCNSDFPAHSIIYSVLSVAHIILCISYISLIIIGKLHLQYVNAYVSHKNHVFSAFTLHCFHLLARKRFIQNKIEKNMKKLRTHAVKLRKIIFEIWEVLWMRSTNQKESIHIILSPICPYKINHSISWATSLVHTLHLSCVLKSLAPPPNKQKNKITSFNCFY